MGKRVLTEDNLRKELNKLQRKITNLRETNKMLIAKRAMELKELERVRGTLEKLQDAKMEELASEYLGVYLKWITEQHGEERFDEETGEPIGKLFSFTFQEKNDNVFNMMTAQDEEGRLTLVCSSAYPIEEGESNGNE